MPPSAPQPEDAPPAENAKKLIRSLLALPELQMRVAWLNEKLLGSDAHLWAPVLDQLAERAQTTDRSAREAIMALALLLAERHESAWLWSLREAAKNQALLNVERLLRQPPRDEEAPPSVELEPKIPDYGTGRELTVGERRTLARRPSREQLEKLLLDPHPLVIEQVFQCPTITESDVITVATRRPARLHALTLLATSARWMARRRVKMSVILNPGTPHGLAVPFVSTCPREDLHLIASTTTVSVTLRSIAHELYGKLPPVPETATHRVHQ